MSAGWQFFRSWLVVASVIQLRLAVVYFSRPTLPPPTACGSAPWIGGCRMCLARYAAGYLQKKEGSPQRKGPLRLHSGIRLLGQRFWPWRAGIARARGFRLWSLCYFALVFYPWCAGEEANELNIRQGASFDEYGASSKFHSTRDRAKLTGRLGRRLLFHPVQKEPVHAGAAVGISVSLSLVMLLSGASAALHAAAFAAPGKQ